MLKIAINLEPEELDWLMRLAKAERVSESHIVSRALQKMREDADSPQFDGIMDDVCRLLDDEGRFNRRH